MASPEGLVALLTGLAGQRKGVRVSVLAPPAEVSRCGSERPRPCQGVGSTCCAPNRTTRV